MDMFRSKYKRVVFLYVSDDIDWAERKLGKYNLHSQESIFILNFSVHRISTKDFYIASSPEDGLEPMVGAAVDMAVVSQCNHSVTSHGTFSFWAGLLAGRGTGYRVIPAMLPGYRGPGQTSRHLDTEPWHSDMPRFYLGMRHFR